MTNVLTKTGKRPSKRIDERSANRLTVISGRESRNGGLVRTENPAPYRGGPRIRDVGTSTKPTGVGHEEKLRQKASRGSQALLANPRGSELAESATGSAQEMLVHAHKLDMVKLHLGALISQKAAGIENGKNWAI